MRYTIDELIKAFGNGEIKGSASSMTIEGNYLYSYRTVIAIRLKTGAVLLNGYNYSKTTTRHQNKVRKYCNVINTLDNEEDLIKRYKITREAIEGIWR